MHILRRFNPWSGPEEILPNFFDEVLPQEHRYCALSNIAITVNITKLQGIAAAEDLGHSEKS